MNFAVFLFLCAVLSLGYTKKYTYTLRPSVKFPESVTVEVQKAIKLCIARTGISEDIVIVMKAGIYTEDILFQEFIYCVFQESRNADVDGHVLVDKTSKYFPENVKDILDKCNEENGKDAKETTFKFYKCFQDTSPVLPKLS